MMDKLTVNEMIDAIKKNYPPPQYSMLMEALDHASELMKAEAQGRLVVLPCKVGTPIYWINFNQHDGYWIELGEFHLQDIGVFGKTVFLTCEAAEAKLKEREGK